MTQRLRFCPAYRVVSWQDGYRLLLASKLRAMMQLIANTTKSRRMDECRPTCQPTSQPVRPSVCLGEKHVCMHACMHTYMYTHRL